MQRPRSTDDRNYTHYLGFKKYRALSGKDYSHAIELGCGPFTNLRYIGRVCKIEKCDLLDPLLNDYLTHPNCRYPDGLSIRMESRLNILLNGFRLGRRTLRMVPPGVRSFGSPRLTVANLLANPLEEATLRQPYDLIVIVNVIEHCYDLNLAFDMIERMAAPNSVLVFHDKLFDHDRVAYLVNGHLYDAGHPIMADRRVIEGFLRSFGTPLFWHQDREAGAVYDRVYCIIQRKTT
jgi:hypothetical protein